MDRSRYWEIVEQFGKLLAAQSGQVLIEQPGNLGWELVSQDPDSQVPTIRLAYREEARHEHGSPPRIVCVAKGGPIIPPDQVGGRMHALGGERANARRVRVFTINVYVWGQDDGQSDSLLNNSVIAFSHIYSDSGQPGKGAVFGDELWEDQQPGAGGQETYGSEISFSVTFEFTVTDAPDELTIVQSINIKLHEQTESELENVDIA